MNATRRQNLSDQQIIDMIFQIRVRNNIPWKKLIEIAFRYAPDETRAALRDIAENDHAIADLTRMLTQ